jgi:hypothetical protein
MDAAVNIGDDDIDIRQVRLAGVLDTVAITVN